MSPGQKQKKKIELMTANKIHLTISANEEDIEWLRLLFTRNKEPFKALNNIGYTVVE